MYKSAKQNGPLTVAFLLLSRFYAQAGTFYVSPTGNDSNPGTLAQPWLTLSHAAGAISGGDIVNIRAGNYAGSGYQNITPPAGNSSNYTIFQGYSGDAMPVIDGSGQCVLNLDASYVKIAGLHIKGGGQGEQGTITIGNNGNADHVVIDSDVISDANVGGPPDTSNPSEIRISYGAAATNVTIQNNEIYGSYGRGIIINAAAGHASNVTIQNNFIHDVAMGVNIKWGTTTDRSIVIAYNRIQSCVDPHNIGLEIDQNYVLIHDNIIDTCTMAFEFGNNWNGQFNTIRHNTLYGNTKSVYVGNYGGNNTFIDNIRFNTSTIESYGATNTYSDFTSDPLFANAANHDFHLQAGSAAIAGASDGKDMGAQICAVGPNASCSLTSAAAPPAAPRGLTLQ